MTKIAERDPFFCASCHGRPEGAVYVDFEAYYDGPVINAEDNIKATIDDLIICNECLDTAARLLGYVPESTDETARANVELKAAAAKQSRVIASQAKRLELIEKAAVGDRAAA
jgi:hypothetical protein